MIEQHVFLDQYDVASTRSVQQAAHRYFTHLHFFVGKKEVHELVPASDVERILFGLDVRIFLDLLLAKPFILMVRVVALDFQTFIVGRLIILALNIEINIVAHFLNVTKLIFKFIIIT